MLINNTSDTSIFDPLISTKFGFTGQSGDRWVIVFTL